MVTHAYEDRAHGGCNSATPVIGSRVSCGLRSACHVLGKRYSAVTPRTDANHTQAGRDLNFALGCAFGFALLVVVALLVYLWTL